MGILSEIDMMNRDAEDDAFEVSSDSETVDSFSEEFEPVEPPKPKPQEEEAEEARKKAMVQIAFLHFRFRNWRPLTALWKRLTARKGCWLLPKLPTALALRVPLL